jgi:hypothetical protein
MKTFVSVFTAVMLLLFLAKTCQGDHTTYNAWQQGRKKT